MYQDRRAQFGTTVINGGSDMTFRGGLYFPAREMQFNGNASMSTECVQMVARRLDFRGNGSVSNTCPANSGARAFDAAFVRLVG